MKTRIKYWVCAVILILSIVVLKFCLTPTHSNISKPSKADRIDEAIEMEIAITQDLALGYVPKSRLYRANNIAAAYKTDAYPRRPDHTIQWRERGPINVGGRTRAMIFDALDSTGTTILAGSVSGGIWRGSQIFTAKPFWTNLTPTESNLAIGALAQDLFNPFIIYAGTGEGWFNGDAVRGFGILKSIDGGNSWSRIQNTNNSQFKYIQKIVVDRFGHVYACTRDNGVMKSMNQGEHWVKILGNGIHAFSDRAADIEIAQDGTLFASLGIFSSDGLYRSDDDGNNWQFIHQNGIPANDFRRAEIAVAPSNSNVVYAILEDNGGSCLGIYRSGDKGNNWTSLPIPTSASGLRFGRNQLWYDLALSVDPKDHNRLIIGGVNLFQSTNGGGSWIQLSNWFETSEHAYVHADQHSILFHNDNSSRALFANDGGVFACNNLNTTTPTFLHVVTDYNVTQFYSCAIHPMDPGQIAGGSQDNGCLVFPNDLTTIATTVTSGDGGFVHYAGETGEYLITSFTNNNYNIYLNNDLIDELSLQGGLFVNPTTVDNKYFYGNADQAQYFRINLEGNIEEDYVFVPEFKDLTIRHIACSPNISNRLYFGLSEGRVYYVDDADKGDERTAVQIMNKSGSVSCIAIEKGNENHMLVTISNYGEVSVWETRDGGTNWKDVENNIPDMPVRWVVFAPGRTQEALLATEAGVWRTDSLQGTQTQWYPSPDFPNARTDMIKVHEASGKIVVATHGRGLFTTDYYQPYVANFNQKTDVMKISVFPNPTSTHIHIQSAAQIAGRYNIYTLDGTSLQSGIFRGNNKINIYSLPSGSYLLSIENIDGVLTKRFLKI
jgi:photosystem II stability/assembly factor-like uncharacterized protein